MKLKAIASSLVLSAFLVGSASAASVIVTPVSATASSEKSPASAAALIDGSGLTVNTIDGVHFDGASNNNTLVNSWIWQDGGTSPTNPIISGEFVVFDMGSLTQLTGTYVWQTVAYSSNGRQTRTFDIEVSDDGVSFTTITANALLGQVATPANGSTAQYFSFGASPVEAQYVRFGINGTYENNAGNQNWIGGLGEVRFEAIPEPSAALLGGLGLLALLRRRR